MVSMLPVVRSGIAAPAIRMARDLGIPIRKIEKHAGLPALDGIENDPSITLPLVAMITFLEDAAEHAGLPLFGMQAARAYSTTYFRSLRLDFGSRINLMRILPQFCQCAPMQSSIADLRLTWSGNLVRLSHMGRPPVQPSVQSDLLTIGLMIELVRRFTGPHWRPAAIHFCASPSADLLGAGAFDGIELHFNQQFRAIEFPYSVFALERHLAAEGSAGGEAAVVHPGEKLTDRLKAILPHYLDIPWFGSARLEDFSGTSFRNLQRRLRAEGTSFFDIRDEVRRQIAQNLLRDSDGSLAEIAQRLGYSDACNFSRAFRRWTGISPGRYRQMSRSENGGR